MINIFPKITLFFFALLLSIAAISKEKYSPNDFSNPSQVDAFNILKNEISEANKIIEMRGSLSHTDMIKEGDRWSVLSKSFELVSELLDKNLKVNAFKGNILRDSATRSRDDFLNASKIYKQAIDTLHGKLGNDKDSLANRFLDAAVKARDANKMGAFGNRPLLETGGLSDASRASDLSKVYKLAAHYAEESFNQRQDVLPNQARTDKENAVGFRGLADSLERVATPNTPSRGLLDRVLEKYKTKSQLWKDKLTEYASWLFWILVLISMVWTYGFMILKHADIQEFFSETIRFLCTTGFFFWILINGPAMALDIFDSFSKMAGNASGFSTGFTPSSILDIGFEILNNTIRNMSIYHISASLGGLLIGVALVVVMALIAINLLLLLVSMWILSYAGIVLLGFGGGRWTSEIAINYFRNALKMGLRGFGMVLVVGIGKSFLDDYINVSQNSIQLYELVEVLVASIILLFLVNKIPEMLANMADGLAGGPGHFSRHSARTAIGATAGAAAGAAFAIAGGASALSAAFKTAGNVGAEAAGGAQKIGSGNGGSGSKNSGGRSSGGFSSGEFSSGGSGSGANHSNDSNSERALSNSDGVQEASSGSAHSGSSGTNGDGAIGRLASGTLQVAKNAAKDRMAQTTGGKIAQAIRASEKNEGGLQQTAEMTRNVEGGSGGGSRNNANETGSNVAYGLLGEHQSSPYGGNDWSLTDHAMAQRGLLDDTDDNSLDDTISASNLSIDSRSTTRTDLEGENETDAFANRGNAQLNRNNEE